MDETLRELEDRVRRAAAEIRELRRRRRELENEIAVLRGRAADAGAGAAPAWDDERRRIVAALRETVAGLRGD